MSSCLKINNTISQRGGDVAERYSSCMEFFFKGTLASRPYCKISHQSINYGSIHKESLEIIHELSQVDSSEDVSSRAAQVSWIVLVSQLSVHMRAEFPPAVSGVPASSLFRSQ